MESVAKVALFYGQLLGYYKSYKIEINFRWKRRWIMRSRLSDAKPFHLEYSREWFLIAFSAISTIESLLMGRFVAKKLAN
jgi:hypothetical protein